MKVEKGNKVQVEYEGKFDDGTVFDSSKTHGKPLEFIAGKGLVVPGFDNAVVGMEEGEEKEFTIKPEEGYGQINAQMVQEVPKEQLPKEQEPKVGMVLGVGLPNGQQIPARITKVTEDKVTIDLNHPLAGKTLHFKIKVVKVEEISEEDLKKMEEAKEEGCGNGGCGSGACGSHSEEKMEKEGCCNGGSCGSEKPEAEEPVAEPTEEVKPESTESEGSENPKTE